MTDRDICPREGSFRAFKKVVIPGDSMAVLELEIPDDARRTSSLIGRKCRCDHARVIGVVDGTPSEDGTYSSWFDRCFTYKVGEVVREPRFDNDIRRECRPGIHFFMTLEEAQAFP